MPEGIQFDANVAVTMSDGLELRINIYRPSAPGRYPVIMLMGPYGKDTAFSDAPAWCALMEHVPSLTKTSSCRLIRWEAPDPEGCYLHLGSVRGRDRIYRAGEALR